MRLLRAALVSSSLLSEFILAGWCDREDMLVLLRPNANHADRMLSVWSNFEVLVFSLSPSEFILAGWCDREDMLVLLRPNANHADRMLSVWSNFEVLVFSLSPSEFILAGWCDREDSNFHGSPRYHLKVVCLPIPPRSHTSQARLAAIANVWGWCKR